MIIAHPDGALKSGRRARWVIRRPTQSVFPAGRQSALPQLRTQGWRRVHVPAINPRNFTATLLLPNLVLQDGTRGYTDKRRGEIIVTNQYVMDGKTRTVMYEAKLRMRCSSVKIYGGTSRKQTQPILNESKRDVSVVFCRQWPKHADRYC